jgi:nicotinate-nucleotide adenylyltransferase
VIGLFGGAFDPPHNGHVALARAAATELALDEVLVLVSADPGHKQVETPPETRLALAQAAFPELRVVLDTHARTVELLRAHPEWDDVVVLIGADQFCEFLSWQEPDEVLRRARIGVATRPGFPRGRIDAVLAQLETPERVLLFDLEPLPVASSELRERLDRDLVPAAVWEIIERDRLYGGARLGVA